MQVIKSAGPKSSAGRGERRLLRAVTMGQTALTLALLVGAGLLLRTTSNLSRVQSGYNIEQILTMTVTAVQGDWNNFHTRALERVSSLSGVQRAAFAWGVPLTGNNWPGTFEIEGQPPIAQAERRGGVAGAIGHAGLLRYPSDAAHRGPGLPRVRCERDGAPESPSSIARSPTGTFRRHQRDRQEALAGQPSAAADRNRRRRGQQPHRRSDPGAGAGDLSVALAGGGLLEGPDRSHDGGSARAHGRVQTRAARGRSHGRDRERQDAGAGP